MTGRVVRRAGESDRQVHKRALRELAAHRFVTVELVCRRDHAGEHRAASLSLNTQPEAAFDDAWPDYWLDGEVDPTQGERTRLEDGADGHRTVTADCPTCRRPVRIRESRLRALLRELWQPGAWRSTTWPPA